MRFLWYTCLWEYAKCQGNACVCYFIVTAHVYRHKFKPSSNFIITAVEPSQPERPCLYYNGTHIVLCSILPFSHLAITALTIQMSTTCGRRFDYPIANTNFCKPILVNDIMNMTLQPHDCQPANFSITAHSDAGESQPSPPAAVSANG